MRIAAIGRLLTQFLGINNTGMSDWIAQRLSGLVIGAYTLFLVGWLILVPNVTFENWQALFSNVGMQIFTLFCLLALCLHSWIGMWTIGTDYLRPHTAGRHADSLRSVFNFMICGFLLIYLFWGLWILWGN